MKISKRNLKKRAEKEVERKIKRKEKHKIKIRKIEEKNKKKQDAKNMFILLGNISLAKFKDIKDGNNPTKLKVPEDLFELLNIYKANDDKIMGLDLEKWDQEKDNEIILKNSIDINVDFMVL